MSKINFPTASFATFTSLPLWFSIVTDQPFGVVLIAATNGNSPEVHQSLKHSWLVHTGTNTSALKLSPV